MADDTPMARCAVWTKYLRVWTRNFDMLTCSGTNGCRETTRPASSPASHYCYTAEGCRALTARVPATWELPPPAVRTGETRVAMGMRAFGETLSMAQNARPSATGSRFQSQTSHGHTAIVLPLASGSESEPRVLERRPTQRTGPVLLRACEDSQRWCWVKPHLGCGWLWPLPAVLLLRRGASEPCSFTTFQR